MAKRFTPPVRVNVGAARLTGSGRGVDVARSMRTQFRNILRNYEAWEKHMTEVTGDVMVEALQPTFDKSQKIVPVDTSDLKKSGYLESRTFRGRSIAEIGYGRGGSPNYAVVVHENLEAFHEAPTSAKYLERPLLEDEAAIGDRIAEGLRRASGV